jgi:hypothetical protein
MQLIGPTILDQLEAIHRRVVRLGKLHGVSGRQMAALIPFAEKKVRDYVTDPHWAPSSPELIVSMEAALADLGLLDEAGDQANDVLLGPPSVRASGSDVHHKAHLDQRAALIDPQLRYLQVYLAAATKAGVLREKDIKWKFLRAKAPDCAIHVYRLDDSIEHVIVEGYVPVTDYIGGRDMNGADILADFPSAMSECIREDLVVALRKPSRSHWSMLYRNFGSSGYIPRRAFLRFLKYFIGDGDVPKMLVARSLQPVEAAAHYFDGLGVVGPREVE